MEYSKDLAQFYADSGLSGTYGLYMPLAVDMLGNLENKSVLDYGCGTGRMSRIMQQKGAASVTGLDVSDAMIAKAKEYETGDMTFSLIDSYRDKTTLFDACLCANVIPEIPDQQTLETAFSDIYRLLRTGGSAVLTATNPAAAGHEFSSFRFGKPATGKGGDKVDCFIRNGDVENLFIDYYWPEADIRETLERQGFSIVEIVWPLAKGTGWVEETKIAPELILKAVKL